MGGGGGVVGCIAPSSQSSFRSNDEWLWVLDKAMNDVMERAEAVVV